jgi:hypothetical protein
MATRTHTHGRNAKDCHPAREQARATVQDRDETRPDLPVWPTAAEVWNWSESAVLSGYGPAASRFI